MTRFFFNRLDGVVENDEIGLELNGIAEARRQAILYAGESLKDSPGLILDGDDLKIEVKDDSDVCLFSIIIMTIDAPATQHIPRGVPKLQRA